MLLKRLLIVSTALILTACLNSQPSEDVGPIPVKLAQNNGQWQIIRNGEPYFIRGAGGHEHMALLQASGGNSVRTWTTRDAKKVLDEAYERGMTVMMGLWLEHERHGFDYSNKAAVAAQKAKIREQIIALKDHPALMIWGVGNEVDLMYSNTDVWYAVEDIAQMIKTLDPNHLVTTVTAGIDAERARLIKARVPSIDYLSINKYGGMEDLPETLTEVGYNGPYVVTEWGPTGFWETTLTDWKAAIEQTSTEKAAIYQMRYNKAIAGEKQRALGSYTFLWGQKQETTPTWFGLFLENGDATEVVDAMQYLWTGTWPKHRAPSIRYFRIDGKRPEQSIYLKPGHTYSADVDAFQPQGENFNIRWEFLLESTDIKAGGDPESRPQEVKDLIVRDNNFGNMTFKAPEIPGAYRLFVYVSTEHDKAATANIPFFVK